MDRVEESNRVDSSGNPDSVERKNRWCGLLRCSLFNVEEYAVIIEVSLLPS